MKKIALLFLLLPLCLFATPRYQWGIYGYREVAPSILVDQTTYVQNIISTGGTLPTGTYSVTHLTLPRSFNFGSSTLNCTSTSGALFTASTAGVTVSGGTMIGSGGTANNGGLSCFNVSAANITITGMVIQNFNAYAISATNTPNIHITNNIISNIGYLGISLISNSSLETGVIVSGNTINRSMQPAATVPQSALIVRSFAPGSIPGAQIHDNIFTMPLNPTIDAAECFEIRNSTGAKIYNNIFTNGSIGLSIVGGCTGTQAYNNTFQGQNREAVEFGESPNSSLKNSTISSGHIGVLFDGNIGNVTDTVQNVTISGLTGSNPYPIEINVNTSTQLGLLFDHVTINTTTRAVSLENSSGITINNMVATGNNTTYAIFLVQSIGNVNINNSTFSGFNPKIMFATISSGMITINNIIGQGVAPTGSFLGINSFGAVTQGPNIHWNAGPAVPSIRYNPNVYSFFINSPITPINITSSGGAVTGYTITGQPSGLSFSTSTGAISGTPLSLQPQTSYVTTGTNVSGSDTAVIRIAVIDHAPIISFSPNTQVAILGVPITPMTAVNSGGAVVNYTVTPSLPTGLSLGSNGTISGTPSVLSPTTAYTITGFNSGGSSPTTVTLTVNPPAPAIPNISYSPNTFSFPINVGISPISPINTGGDPASYGISPALPTGLSFDTSTGVVSGLPTSLLSSTAFDVSATNISGTAHTTLNLAVMNVPPPAPAFSYVPNNVTLTINQSAILLSPTSTGGTVSTYSVTPALPTGLVLDASTGIVSGVPTVTSPTTTYDISGVNVTGTGHAALTITVTNQSPGVVIRVGGFVARFN